MDKTKETGNQVYRSYKDRLFRMVFREKKELRSWSNGRTIYGRQLVRIPTPRFFVFYNGRDMQPERQVLKLSDAFMNPEEDPALELKVVMLNINLGRNKELMEQCHTLLEYAQFVDRLRTCEKSMGREEADGTGRSGEAYGGYLHRRRNPAGFPVKIQGGGHRDVYL